jgi:nucleotide-binding universal stress UspA family protein
MAQSPVIVGVDPTPAGALAATVGCAVAGAMEAPCHLVHVVREPAGLSRGKAESTERADTLDRFLDATRSALERSLAPHLTASALEHLDVHIGNPAWVLGQVARDDGARLLVLGGKHHSAAVRWFGGSTAHHAVRTIDVPLLVAAAPKTRFDRVLVACDLSDASAPTLEAARAFGRPFGARLRMLTVVEPLPAIPGGVDRPDRLRRPDDRGRGCQVGCRHRGGGVARQGMGRSRPAGQHDGASAEPAAVLDPRDTDPGSGNRQVKDRRPWLAQHAREAV